MGNHDARIEDNNRDMHDLVGTISYMKEDLRKLANMNQRSHIHDSLIWDQEIEETSIVYPVKDGKEKQWE